MSTSFYTPLNENETRVLEITPTEDFSDTINTTCRIIFLASDTSTEAYTALSYTWGAPDNTSYICVNGCKHKVTPNLESALRHLRDHKDKVFIWVDAVCINQNDIPERDSQLKMMADVYKKAEGGLSWLGEEYEDSSIALKMIKRWASFSIDKQPRETLCAFLRDKLQDELSMPRSITALKNLCRRPYWTRVWIQQEVALPPIVTMQCGHERLSFNVVIHFGIMMQSLQGYDDDLRFYDCGMMPKSDDTGPLFNLISCRLQQLIDYKKEEAPNLLGSLFASYLLKSTDPRDRIYALLGLPGFKKY
ncbi:hypothetical protein EAE96_005706 [Botrytis aclada]|nr:hypothetical protein EAE96_005706 [Botrytis aclada]